MRHSRWLRRRYYPLFLESLAKKIQYLLIAWQLDIEWTYESARTLRKALPTNFIPIVILQPKEAISFATNVLFLHSAVWQLNKITAYRLFNYISTIRELDSVKLANINFGVSEITNPQLIILQNFLALRQIEQPINLKSFNINYILTKAEAEGYFIINLLNYCIARRRADQTSAAPLTISTQILPGLIFSNILQLFAAASEFAPSLVFLCPLQYQFKLFFPYYFHKFFEHLITKGSVRGAKYFQEDEIVISPFLYPPKLNTAFYFNINLEKKFNRSLAPREIIKNIIIFDIRRAVPAPEIINLILKFISDIRATSPDIITLTLLFSKDYNISKNLFTALQLETYIYEKESRSYKFLLDLLISDVGGDLIIDTYKLIFDLIEAKFLQPAVAKIKI